MTSSSTMIINDIEYNFIKVDPFKQFHIVRRLAPIFGELSGIAQGAAEGKKVDPFEALVPVADALSKLPDDEVEAVLFTLLGCVTRKSGGGYAPIVAPGTKSLMFQDIELPLMLQLAGRALMHNLGNFFAAKALVSTAENQKQNPR